jgi:hypothetical protein
MAPPTGSEFVTATEVKGHDVTALLRKIHKPGSPELDPMLEELRALSIPREQCNEK